MQASVKKLTEWLKSWEKSVAAEEAGAGGAGAPTSAAAAKKAKFKRAALLSGAPGIGKTTAAHIVAKSLGFDVLELNASDTRSRAQIKASLLPVIGNRVLNFGVKGQPRGGGSATAGAGSSSSAGADLTAGRMAGFAATKRVIIMDEVDGMSTGDFGGNAELIALVKKTTTPVICVCNDRQKDGVKNLAEHCLDLKFTPPEVPKVVARLSAIAAAEHFNVEPAAIEALVSSTNGDIRQIINALMMWRVSVGGGRATLTGAAAKDRLQATEKDESLRLTSLDAVARMFSPDVAKVNLATRCDAFYIDYDTIPLLVQMYYPSTLAAGHARDSDTIRLGRMCRAADSISLGDIAMKRVRGNQDWKLLPLTAWLNTDAAFATNGPIAGHLSKFPECVAS